MYKINFTFLLFFISNTINGSSSQNPHVKKMNLNDEQNNKIYAYDSIEELSKQHLTHEPQRISHEKLNNFIKKSNELKATLDTESYSQNQHINKMIAQSNHRHNEIKGMIEAIGHGDESLRNFAKHLDIYIKEIKNFNVIIPNNNNNTHYDESEYRKYVKKTLLETKRHYYEDIERGVSVPQLSQEYNEVIKLTFYELLFDDIHDFYNIHNTRDNKKTHIQEEFRLLYRKLTSHFDKYKIMYFVDESKKYNDYAEKIFHMNHAELKLFYQYVNENLRTMPQDANLGTIVEIIEKKNHLDKRRL